MSRPMEFDWVVLRSNGSGVWLGRWGSVQGDIVHLLDARRAWDWEGALSCSELANDGPRGGRICAPVARVLINGWTEIIPATPEALERWNEQPHAEHADVNA